MVELGKKHRSLEPEDPSPSGPEIIVVVLGQGDLPEGNSFIAAIPEGLQALMQPGDVVIHVDGKDGLRVAGIEQVAGGPDDDLLDELRCFVQDKPGPPKAGDGKNRRRPNPEDEKRRSKRRGGK